jgi:hypothetical protein
MSRHVIKRGVRSPRHDTLVDELKSELASGNRPQPAFIEEDYAPTKSRHIYVVWDRWASVPEDERIEVIIRAYEEFEGPGSSENIAVAIGVTGSEAIETGLLPFKVDYPHSSVALIDHEAAKKSERTATILGKNASELRYPTREEAEAAIQRLRSVLPNSDWTVIHEVEK